MDNLAEAEPAAVVTTVEQLEVLYGQPGEASLVKELDRIIPEYAAFIEASPFVALATGGPEGLDCSPRGEQSNPSGPPVASATKGEASMKAAYSGMMRSSSLTSDASPGWP